MDSPDTASTPTARSTRSPDADADSSPRPDRRRLLRAALGAFALVVLAAAAVVAVNTRRLAREHDRLAADLLARARRRTGDAVTPSPRFDPADVADLPAPVRRYFEAVLPPGQPPIRAVRLAQSGDMRLGDADSPWRPFRATQWFTTDPPGFVWDATVDVLPLVPARVVDVYRAGEGFLRAKLLSTITVADAAPSPAMDEGELVRYLAEAVWFPTALLPSAGVEWTAVGDDAARATLRDGGTVASVVFHFAGEEVRRVTAERYRSATDDDAPWTGTFRRYETRHGVRVPTAAAVSWSLPEGELRYWRAQVEAIEYLDVE